MTDLNSIAITGRTTRDAEIKYTNGGTTSVRFSVAVNRSQKDGDGWKDVASFFDVSIMGKIAEAVHPKLTKGKRVAVSGELRQDRWEKDGQAQSKVYLFADRILIYDSDSSRVPSNEYRQGGVQETFDDDIPF